MGILGFWPVSCTLQMLIFQLIKSQHIKAAEETRNYLELTTAECFKNGVQECRPLIMGVDASFEVWESPSRSKPRPPALQTLYYKLAALLEWPVLPLFVIDGPARQGVKRGRQVLTRGHPLTAVFQELVGHFGYPCYMAPGEADAELGRLASEGIIDFVQTTDSDVFLFGSERVIYTPNKKRDGNDIKVYTSEKIFTTPSIGLTRGGILLFALLAGGDYDSGSPGCGPVTAHAIARGGLGDQLLHHALEFSDPTAEFLHFLAAWKQQLCKEFAEDPHGLLGRKYKSIAQTIADSDFPNANPSSVYTWPLAASPDVERIARFCQLQFRWDASTVAAKLSQGLFPGVAIQSLLKPYDLHALMEAHLELGLSTDADDFPRSSVLQVLKTKTVTHHGRSLLLYQVQMSVGALSLRAKAGLTDASAFVIPAAMCKWIPAAIMDYALPGLLSRSVRSTTRKSSKAKTHVPKARKPAHKAAPVA
ncbi:PIN domain-like protein [Favolaschia claudopus]|uniref:PIN domain-like protein n=1 Tax=Favolaschia claudopus TaxID=2862362 RepID=A0AAV9Z4V8_9AGAR